MIKNKLEATFNETWTKKEHGTKSIPFRSGRT